MPVPVNIPAVSYNTWFGNVGKVVWFATNQNFNYYDLSFNLTLVRDKKTNIVLYDNIMDTAVWQNTYPADVNQPQYADYVRILNVPTGSEQPMAIINLAT